MDHEREIPFREPRHHFKMWIALLAGPVAWIIGLAAKYAIVPFACGATSSLGLHLVSVVTLTIAVYGGVLGWQLWQQSAKEWPDDAPSPVVRTRFMAVMALMSGVLFSLGIIAQWITSAFLHPCMGI